MAKAGLALADLLLVAHVASATVAEALGSMIVYTPMHYAGQEPRERWPRPAVRGVDRRLCLVEALLRLRRVFARDEGTT